MKTFNTSHVTILRRPEVQARTGLSRSTMYERIRQGEFPRPISLGAKAVGWLEHEIDAWLAERIAASRANHVTGA